MEPGGHSDIGLAQQWPMPESSLRLNLRLIPSFRIDSRTQKDFFATIFN